MHGQPFFSHQHYLQQQAMVATSQNTGGSRNPAEIVHPAAHLGQQYVQHSQAVNGQAYQAHNHAQRTQRVAHYSGLTQQQYNQLLRDQNLSTIYNSAIQANPNHTLSALRNQGQSLQTGHQQVNHQQQTLLQRQQNAADHSATLRNMLSNQYHQSTLNPMQQHMASLNQLQQQHVANSIQQIANNLQLSEHMQSTAKAPVPHLTRILLSNEQQARRTEMRQQETPVAQTQRLANQVLSPTIRTLHPNPSQMSPSMLNSEILLPRHLSPSAHPRLQTPYRQNASASPNVYSNVLLSPEMQNSRGLISPHRSTYQPVGHIPHLNTRVQASPRQMTRTEISTPQEQNLVRTMMSPTQHHQEQAFNRTMQSPPQRVTTTGPVIQTEVQVKRQTASVNSNAPPVILVISDSDDDDNTSQQHRTRQESSEHGSTQERKTKFERVVIDDDIEIVGEKEAEIMSHMRSDCPIHIFKRIDSVSIGPQDENAARCSKCFCYVCDRLAAECPSWTVPTFPHCNAHCRASCWKARRNTKKSPLMMKLSAEDITPVISSAGEVAMQYMITIREAYITYRAGTSCDYHQVPCNCACHRPRGQEPCMQCKTVHDMKKKFNYQPVRDIAIKIIEEINAQYSSTKPTAALIMLEAVLAELCSHRPADFNHSTRSPSNPDKKCQCNTPEIMEKYIEKYLIDILVSNEISKPIRSHLLTCVEESIKPLQLEVLKRFLTLRQWDDYLLRAVLTGSNVTGSRSRDVLRETYDIVKMRVEKLSKEKRYQSIIRYLKAVKIQHHTKANMTLAEFNVLLEQWMLLYPAKQGQFKDVVLRLTEPIHKNNGGPPGCALATLPMPFLLELLDSLAGKDILPNTRLESFDPKNSPTPYCIKGKDADVLLLLFEYILDQNKQASTNIPLHIWLAQWVNRTPLSPCVNPTMIKPWVTEGTSIIEQSHQAYAQGHCQALLLQCKVHDPHVHLFTASMNILHSIAQLKTSFQSSHIQAIIDAYKNNEWALFHLLTQEVLMTSGNSDIIKWVSNYSKNNNGILAHFKDKVLMQVIQIHAIDDVTNLLKSVIKSDWTNSIEAIQRTAVMLIGKYAARLLDELFKVNDPTLFFPCAIWLESLVLQSFHEQKIMASIIQDPKITNEIRRVAKICSFLHPIKTNISIYRELAPGTQWTVRSVDLMRFLRGRFKANLLTMEELASYMSLTLTIGDASEMKVIFSHFHDSHACTQDTPQPTSVKVVQEIALLLETTGQEIKLNKRLMLETSRRLCSHETLSWLICTECAKNMPTSWTSVWITLAKCSLIQELKLLNVATMDQFRTWLADLSLQNLDDYNRLMKCLRSFMQTLIETWQKTQLSLDNNRALLHDTAKAIKDPKLQRDFSSVIEELFQAELEKLKPKKTQEPEIQIVAQAAPRILQLPRITPSPRQEVHPPQVPLPHQPPQSSRPHNTIRYVPPPIPHREPDPKPQVPKPKSQPPTVIPMSVVKETPHHSTNTPAMMSPNTLFKRNPQNTKVSPQKLKPENSDVIPNPDSQPFSPPGRTKTCQNCRATISCAVFKCPRCQKVAREVQPVKCPDCKQENRELKGYSCQFCYRSLLDVLFGGGKESTGAEEPPKEPKHKKKSKKKSSEKKKKASDESRVPDNNVLQAKPAPKVPDPVTMVTEEARKHGNDQKHVQPLKIPKSKFQGSSLTDSSDSESDFVVKPPKKRRKKIQSASKVPSVVIKRKPPPIDASSLTDETETESDSEDKKILMISSDEFLTMHPTGGKNISTEDEFTPKTSSDWDEGSKNSKNWGSNMKNSTANTHGSNSDDMEVHRTLLPKPQFYPRMPERTSPTKGIKVTPKVPPVPQPQLPPAHPPVKRRVGHSSTMSKKQKNILSRMKNLGKASQKGPNSTKTTPPGATVPQEGMKSPVLTIGKRPSYENGLMTSPPRNSVEFLRQTERQRHDSSCSSGSVGSSSGLSFSLAAVDKNKGEVNNKGHKKRRNVGHRTGGHPTTPTKYETNRTLSYEEAPSNSKTIFPQPLNLNHHGDRKKKKHKKKKEHSLGDAVLLAEKKYDSMVQRRRPGPASRTGYRAILKMAHKLKRQRMAPHKRWHLPPHVSVPRHINLSHFAIVSLSQYPRHKLARIQSLVRNASLVDLYA